MNIFVFLSACLLLGSFAGLAAGLLGVGGGLLIVPVLAGLFHLQGFDSDVIMPLAVGTSLATILFTSLSSALAHHRRGAVRWALVLQLSAGVALGGWLGGFLAVWLGGAVMSLVFGVFELLVAAQMRFALQPHGDGGGQAPAAATHTLAGAVIGAVSALLGIGGGTLTVPWLLWHTRDMRVAVGTSSACGFPIALFGAAGFAASGWGHAALPSGSSGFIYWPAVLGIALGSVFSAPFGARLAHSVDQRRLRDLFALLLVVLGLVMIARGVWV